MAEIHEDAVGRLLWALRRYAWIPLVTVVTFTLFAGLVPRSELAGETDFRATALVIGADLDIRPEQLPRFSHTVFTSGDVAEATISRLQLDVDRSDLIPEYIDLEPVEDTPLLRVIGIHEDPERAAELANVAADVLIDELNRAGPSVGLFVLQTAARAPRAPASVARPALPFVLGGIGGLILGLGIIGLLMALRRPVLSGRSIQGVVGAPVIGRLAMRRRGPQEAPERVPGLAALVSRLFADGRGLVVLVAGPRDRRLAARVARTVAHGAARQGPIVVVAEHEWVPQGSATLDQTGQARRAYQRGNLQWVRSPEELPDDPFVRAIMVGPALAALDVPQLLPPSAGVALVVAEGTPARVVERASEQFLPGEIAGIVFVARVPWGRALRGMVGSRRAGRRSAASAGRAGSTTRDPTGKREQAARAEFDVPS